MYSVYQRQPERPFILEEPYTSFFDEDGNGFDSDLLLQDYLNKILGREEVSSGSVSVSDTTLQNKVTDLIIAVDTMTEQIKITNMHLATITENWITEKDI